MVQPRAEKADRILNSPESYPGLVPRQLKERQFLMWNYPTFEAYVSWAVFARENTSWVRRIVWDRLSHLPLNEAEPITYAAEVLISPKWVKQRLELLSAISLRPLQRSESIGVDGTIRGIEMGTPLLSCRLSWWDVPSPDWEPLISWFEETMSYFEDIMPPRSDRVK